MSIRSFFPKQPKGDTIVEVLLSIAIAGMVIGGSYALAGRSLRQGITASERTEAVKIAESQIESLKFREQHSSKEVWQNNFINSHNFCLITTASNESQPEWIPKFNTGSPEDLRVKGAIEGYDLDCVKPRSVTQAKYFINITIPPAGAGDTNPTYLITVRWKNIGGGDQQNKTQVYYRF